MNLFATCLAEEVLFRGIIQRQLVQLIPTKPWLAIAIVAFGGAHFSGGTEYVLLATLAGCGYVFYRAQKLYWAIGSHVAVNLVHFCGFTHPLLS